LRFKLDATQCRDYLSDREHLTASLIASIASRNRTE
jgi:hypothetical protein